MSRVQRVGHQPGDPYAQITRVGRWLYEIRIHWPHPVGLTCPPGEASEPTWVEMATQPPWLAIGTRNHATRKAGRKLRRHLRLAAYREESTGG